MKAVFEPNAELGRDLEDCRQLAAVVFDHDGVGTQVDMLYGPMQNRSLNPYSQHLMHMITYLDQGTPSGVVELVEHDAVSGLALTRMGVSVDEEGDLSSQFGALEEVDPPHLDWPTLLRAPQLSDCLTNFRQGGEDREVDAPELLGELLAVRQSPRTKPHISVKTVEGLDMQGYSIDFMQRMHRMPRVLANIVQVQAPVAELLHMVARYQGGTVLDVTVLFAGRQKVAELASDGNDAPAQHIRALAGFKRAVFAEAA